jgi:hypothetical protein
MLKRVLMIGLVTCLGLATAGVGVAQAQDDGDPNWIFIDPPGMWWYFGSVNGCGLIGKVPSTTRHPALFQCEATITKFEFCCLNPQNHDVRPGRAGTRVVFIATNPLDQSDLLAKQKGKAQPCVTVNDSSLASPQYCPNPQWTPVACSPDLPLVVTTEFEATCRTIECIADNNPQTTDPCNDDAPDKVANQQALALCTIQEGYGVENGEIPPVPGQTPYECRRCIGPVGAECSITE